MSQSKASKDREMRRRMKNRRPTNREQLLPGKVAKEQRRFDMQYYIMKQQIEKSFPDPTDRLHYINSLLTAMDEQSREIPDTKNLKVIEGKPVKFGGEDMVIEETSPSGRKIEEPKIQTIGTGRCSCGCHGDIEQ